ncbi:MAG: hypothetical protein K2Y22_01155 [Candidatus Obscuribacterales bacterium]|nr:hypothetical protein [Candidatus Obscuribacterales bacterium]
MFWEMLYNNSEMVKLGRYIFATITLFCLTLTLVLTALSWTKTIIWTASPPFYLGIAPWACRFDPISAFFLIVLSIVGIAAVLFSPGYLKHVEHEIYEPMYWLCLLLFLFSMAEVVLAANAITFLLFWEVMSLSSACLVVLDTTKHKAQQAGIIYLAATRFSTAFLTLGFVLNFSRFHSWSFVDWSYSYHGAWLPVILIFLGLAIKAGVWPFHIWLPYAHPEAPAPVSALMSGVMVKVAIYGMIRLLIEGGANSDLLGCLALILGAVSTGWGVLFALVQRDLKRLLAYSTVENVGLILVALAITILAGKSGLFVISSLAFSAALFHILNHAFFKGLLFLGAGAVNCQTGTRDLSLLGGLGKKMPWTMVSFFIGSLSICAMPPLNGFASKWLIYQSLFQYSYLGLSDWQRCVSMILIGVLSAVGALSLACFAKAFGITFLGRARSQTVEHASEVSYLMIGAQMVLALLCFAAGIAVRQVLVAFSPIVAETLNRTVPVEQFFNLPLTILTLMGVGIAFLVTSLVLNRGFLLKQYITWDCGFGDLPARAEETGSSFSQPIGQIFGFLLQAKTTTEIEGKDRRHFPERIHFDISMTSLLEKRIYRPIINLSSSFSRRLLALQTGSIHIHLLYVFLTLLILLGIGTRL